MHKKIKNEIKDLAKEIGNLDLTNNLQLFKEKVQTLYEKLIVATYDSSNEDLVQKNLNDTLETEDSFNKAMEMELQDNVKEEPLFSFENEVEKPKPTIEDELKSAYSIEEATTLFENVTKENPQVNLEGKSKNKTLNDSFFKNNLQIELNDRIAFVNHLFNGSQEDYNRVISQLNSFNSEAEAKHFINKIVKPDYNWNGKEDVENRLLLLIERKFS
ncbi:MAG: hypothetical protein ACWA42_00405 [Lutibacter sp.]